MTGACTDARPRGRARRRRRRVRWRRPAAGSARSARAVGPSPGLGGPARRSGRSGTSCRRSSPHDQPASPVGHEGAAVQAGAAASMMPAVRPQQAGPVKNTMNTAASSRRLIHVFVPDRRQVPSRVRGSRGGGGVDLAAAVRFGDRDPGQVPGQQPGQPPVADWRGGVAGDQAPVTEPGRSRAGRHRDSRR